MLNAKTVVHTELCNSFNTPAVMFILSELVGKTNSYLHDNAEPRVSLLRQIAEYITNMFRIFGMVDPIDTIGFPAGEAQSVCAHCF